jgi:hypothetical protein
LSETLTPVHLRIPIVIGSPMAYWLALTATIEGGVTDDALEALSDYSNIARITRLRVVDAAGNPIAYDSLTSQAGSAYPTGSAPEPSLALLLASAPAVTAAYRASAARISSAALRPGAPITPPPG